MNRSDKIKRIALIVLAALASGYFMYTGFSLLMIDEKPPVDAAKGITPLK